MANRPAFNPYLDGITVSRVVGELGQFGFQLQLIAEQVTATANPFKICLELIDAGNFTEEISTSGKFLHRGVFPAFTLNHVKSFILLPPSKVGSNTGGGESGKGGDRSIPVM